MLRFGLSGEIFHDQGKQLENDLFYQLLKYYGNKRLRTTPYHPKTNDETEGMNQTMLAMLKNLLEHHKKQLKTMSIN